MLRRAGTDLLAAILAGMGGLQTGRFNTNIAFVVLFSLSIAVAKESQF